MSLVTNVVRMCMYVGKYIYRPSLLCDPVIDKIDNNNNNKNKIKKKTIACQKIFNDGNDFFTEC